MNVDRLEVRELDLAVGRRLGSGAQADVFELTQDTGLVFKRYFDAIRVPSLRSLIRWRLELAETDRIRLDAIAAWPHCVVIGQGGEGVGFLMPRVGERFEVTIRGRRRLRELEFLCRPPKKAWEEIGKPPFLDRVLVVADLSDAVSFLHFQQIVMGDLSGTNVLWSTDPVPQVFLVDTDGFRRSGSHPVAVQLDSPNWRAPASLGTASVRTDCYKLGLAVLRVLTASPQLTPDGAASWAVDLPDEDLPEIKALLDRLRRADIPDAHEWSSALGTITRRLRKAGLGSGSRPVRQTIPTHSDATTHLVKCLDDTPRQRTYIRVKPRSTTETEANGGNV